jgi:hypothetical protein
MPQEALVGLEHRKAIVQVILVEGYHERQKRHVAHVRSIGWGHRDSSKVVGKYSKVHIFIELLDITRLLHIQIQSHLIERQNRVTLMMRMVRARRTIKMLLGKSSCWTRRLLLRSSNFVLFKFFVNTFRILNWFFFFFISSFLLFFNFNSFSWSSFLLLLLIFDYHSLLF